MNFREGHALNREICFYTKQGQEKQDQTDRWKTLQWTVRVKFRGGKTGEETVRGVTALNSDVKEREKRQGGVGVRHKAVGEGLLKAENTENRSRKSPNSEEEEEEEERGGTTLQAAREAMGKERTL